MHTPAAMSDCFPTREAVFTTANVQVFLVHLLPNCDCSLSIQASHIQCIAVSDGVTLSQGVTAHVLSAGEEIQLGINERANPTLTLHNQGTSESDCLLLAWLSHTPHKKIPEIPPTEVRPWGSFTVLADTPRFKLKVLVVNPDSRLSLQRHQQREEHWFVIDGTPDVTINDDVIRAKTEQYLHIPRQAWHRLTNVSQAPVSIIELQRGDYFGEDDIERQQDDYGRA